LSETTGVRGDAKLVGKLLKAEANRRARDDEWTALHQTVKREDEALINLLLEWSDIDTTSNPSATPLHLAIIHGQEAKVRLLFEKGTGSQIIDESYDKNALDLAIHFGNREIIQLRSKSKGSLFADYFRRADQTFATEASLPDEGKRNSTSFSEFR
jgi:ankyrin repeat protein